jgi:undecaprenyl-diphosphatase
MMETLQQLDVYLFHLINGHSAPWLDAIMPYWREKSTWIPLYIALAVFVLWKFRLRGVYFLLALALTVGLADTVSSKIIKPAVHRLRPCNEPSVQKEVHLLIECGGGYSFTSSHATNHFAIAAFISMTLGLFFRRIRLPLYLWASSIALAQVYVGVHYPFDVFVGALLGIAIGNIVAKAYLRFPALRLERKSPAA